MIFSIYIYFDSFLFLEIIGWIKLYILQIKVCCTVGYGLWLVNWDAHKTNCTTDSILSSMSEWKSFQNLSFSHRLCCFVVVRVRLSNNNIENHKVSGLHNMNICSFLPKTYDAMLHSIHINIKRLSRLHVQYLWVFLVVPFL